MCLLTYFPPFAEVNTDRLECGAVCNPHGHGFGIVTSDGTVIIEHAMTRPNDLIAKFAKLRKQYPDSHALFHSRITTHGSTNLSNCHPFRVVGPRGGQTILAHNGILPTDCQPTGKDARSDTRKLAEDMIWARWRKFRLPSLGSSKARFTKRWLDSPEVQADIERWLGTGSKVLVLTTNPRMAKTAYLFNERLGEWVDGVWYSNGSYERWTYKGSSVGYTWTSGVGGTGSFRRTQNTPASLWWDELADELQTIGRSAHDELMNELGPGREWHSRESYLHHFGHRTCDVCGANKIARADYICDGCGVCWICNEYFEDCFSSGMSCGSSTIRDEFDRTVGYVRPVDDDVPAPKMLTSKSAAESAEAFSALLFGEGEQ